RLLLVNCSLLLSFSREPTGVIALLRPGRAASERADGDSCALPRSVSRSPRLGTQAQRSGLVGSESGGARVAGEEARGIRPPSMPPAGLGGSGYFSVIQPILRPRGARVDRVRQ